MLISIPALLFMVFVIHITNWCAGCIAAFIALIIFALIATYVSVSKHARFLRKNEGREFFCYTERQTSKSYIETEILPEIPPEIVVVLNGRFKVIVPEEYREISKYVTFWWGNPLEKFPQLLKIINGEVQIVSLHQEFYSNYKRKDGKEIFLAKYNEALEDIRRRAGCSSNTKADG